MSAKRCKRIFEKWFDSDEDSNEYYLYLCERYWDVKLDCYEPREDGTCFCRWIVIE